MARRNKKLKVDGAALNKNGEQIPGHCDSSTETQQASPMTSNEGGAPLLAQNPEIAAVRIIVPQMADPTNAGSSTQEEEESVELKKRRKGGKRRNVYLTDEQKEEVIEFLMRNEGLYNRKKELWQQPDKKNELWQQQGRAMGIEWQDIYTWYETQRRRLGRLKTLSNNFGSGFIEDTWKEADIEFWQRWQFLRSHINTHRSQNPIVRIAPKVEAETEDLPDTCSGQTTPEITGHTVQHGRRSSQTQTANQTMGALVTSSERLNQLESPSRSQQVPFGQHGDRHQFNLWCGSLLQRLPQDLYQQCEAETFRLMTHYRNLAQQRKCDRETVNPPPSQQN